MVELVNRFTPLVVQNSVWLWFLWDEEVHEQEVKCTKVIFSTFFSLYFIDMKKQWEITLEWKPYRVWEMYMLFKISIWYLII